MCRWREQSVRVVSCLHRLGKRKARTVDARPCSTRRYCGARENYDASSISLAKLKQFTFALHLRGRQFFLCSLATRRALLARLGMRLAESLARPELVVGFYRNPVVIICYFSLVITIFPYNYCAGPLWSGEINERRDREASSSLLSPRALSLQLLLKTCSPEAVKETRFVREPRTEISREKFGAVPHG